MTELMVALFDEPDTVHMILGKATEFLVSYAKAFRDQERRIIIAEPAAAFLAPEQCEEFFFVICKMIVDAVQDDYFMVIPHNCGNTVKLVTSMLSTGAMGFHFRERCGYGRYNASDP